MSKININSLRATLDNLTDIGLDKQQVIKYIEKLGLSLLKDNSDSLYKYEGSLVFIDPEDTLKTKQIFRVELSGSSDTGVSTIVVVDDYTGTNFEEVMSLLDPEHKVDRRLANNIYLMGYFQRISDEKEYGSLYRR